MVKGVYDELKKTSPKNHFTIGINDNVTHTSLDYDPAYSAEIPGTVRALFFGLGADGTVGANKNSIKIIGEETDNFAQGYFVYDSKKSGAITTSHLRFGPRPLRSSYLITQASFVACHQFSFLERIDMLRAAEHGATFLLNSIYGPDEVWDHLPRLVQKQIIDKKLKFYVIDGYEVAKQTGMGGRINTIMQTCFFAISGVLPREEAIAAIKHTIEKTYGKRGESVVQKNFAAVDAALSHLHQVKVPGKVTSLVRHPPGGPRRGARVRAEVHRQDHRRQRRRPAGERHAHRRHFPHRHHAMGEAQHRARNPRMGPGALHPVRQVRAGVPARRDPRQGVRRRAPGRRAAHLQGRARALEGHERPEVHPAGGARGLHRLHAVRGVLPGERQEGSEAPRHQHGAAAAHTRIRSGQLGVLPEHPRNRPQDPLHEPGEGRAVAAAAVRVLRRLLRLRRNPLREADDAALRRPHADRQCHRLLLDLRRQPAHHALLRERGGPGADVVQLAVRRLRGVRVGHAARRRQAERVRPRAGRAARTP